MAETLLFQSTVKESAPPQSKRKELASPQSATKETFSPQLTMKEVFSPTSYTSLSQVDDMHTSHTADIDLEANGNKLSGYAQFHTGNSTHSKTNNWSCLPQKSRSYVIPCIVLAILLLIVAPFAAIIALIKTMDCTGTDEPTKQSRKSETLCTEICLSGEK